MLKLEPKSIEATFVMIVVSEIQVKGQVQKHPTYYYLGVG